MKASKKNTSAAGAVTAAILLAALAGGRLQAREWQAWVGMQSTDAGSQALAFLPNELWIHANDSIRWTLASTEGHTVTFLTPGQVKLPFFSAWDVQIGCPGATPDGSSFDGSQCVNSGAMGSFETITGPQTYSVRFPKPGSFKLVCFIHFDMTGSIHVLEPSQTLPHEQDFYNREAQTDAAALVSDANSLTSRGMAEDRDGPFAKVTAGVGEIGTTSTTVL